MPGGRGVPGRVVPGRVVPGGRGVPGGVGRCGRGEGVGRCGSSCPTRTGRPRPAGWRDAATG
ncbi:hypothetical protein DDQ41_26850 [Streptomyces spongiicola]|uniref:Uncharacterized protein n=1 Tax=Streptomyces spongiicola TaxID=1690221 RepID=A0ABM6VDB7_9ACTN|nr:hypothetical protein DDQ41_26850 [Streptomyces spongiicola]